MTNVQKIWTDRELIEEDKRLRIIGCFAAIGLLITAMIGICCIYKLMKTEPDETLNKQLYEAEK